MQATRALERLKTLFNMRNLKYWVTTQMAYYAFFQVSLRKENSRCVTTKCNATLTAVQLPDQNITYIYNFTGFQYFSKSNLRLFLIFFFFILRSFGKFAFWLSCTCSYGFEDYFVYRIKKTSASGYKTSGKQTEYTNCYLFFLISLTLCIFFCLASFDKERIQ